MALYRHYQYVVVNDQIDRAVEEMIQIIQTRMGSKTLS